MLKGGDIEIDEEMIRKIIESLAKESGGDNK